MKYFFTVLMISGLFALSTSFAQSLPIVMDGYYGDWSSSNFDYTDNTNEGGIVDFYDMSVANDGDFLYVRFRVSQEIDLTDNNVLTLHLDTDNNANTGSFAHGIGTELRVNFGFRNINIYNNGSGSGDFNDIDFRVAPTVTSDQFEVAIKRSAVVNGFPIFSGDTIKVAIKDNNNNGDVMPDVGSTFTYVIDNTPVVDIQPIDFEVNTVNGLRLMTYNMENNGLADASRRPSFERILTEIDPDILTFNEGWSIPASSVQNFMNLLLPQPNGWYGYSTGGVITVSKYPMVQNWDIFSGRVNGSLIDVSGSNFGHDSILIVNAHLKCCDGDALRQEQSDRFAQFILDAKSPGGQVTLTDKTPFVLMGDLNLVGQAQQLNTLLTGNIINTGIYGQGGGLDWDNSDLGDALPRHSDGRMTYTWRNDGSSYAPGRIDYLIYSDEVMSIDKKFVIRTEEMSSTRLADYGLNQNDTETASDHYPVVVDFVYATTTPTKPVFSTLNWSIYPNPAQSTLHVQFPGATQENMTIELVDMLGRTAQTWHKVPMKETVQLDVKEFPKGIYSLIIQTSAGRKVKQVILK